MNKYIKDFKSFVNESYDDKPKRKRIDRRYRTCIVCDKPFVAYSGGRRTCSDECMKYYKEHRKEFLSDDIIAKLRSGGLKSSTVQSENRRSKNERYFCELCEKEFNKVTHNENIFNGWDADVLIYDYKIAVLWNGNWHYEEIKKGNSLNQIQNRDKIKIEEINKCGWKPYIIEDRGKYKKSFVEDEFKKFMDFIKTIEEI